MKDFDDVKSKVKEAKNASEREECMGHVASLEEKILAEKERYCSHPEVVSKWDGYLEKIRDIRVERCMKDFNDVKSKVEEAKNTSEREKEKKLEECQKDILSFKGKIDKEKGRYCHDPEVVGLCLIYQGKIIQFRRDLGLSFE